MLRSIARYGAPCTLLVLAMFSWLSGACNGVDVVLADMDDGSTTRFVSTDSGPSIQEAGLIAYCPSNECPPGRATCPTTTFPCDVDLSSDPRNCGSCGVVCPVSEYPGTLFDCVDGRCVIACAQTQRHLDCNGVPDDGCETRVGTNENCAKCGDTCPNPEKPCLDRSGNGDFGCGCPPNTTLCTHDGVPECKDLRNDSTHCGDCDTVCDPNGGADGGTLAPHTAYGCRNGACGHLGCELHFDDCDKIKTNGCETDLLTNDNCNGCGITCPEGQFCALLQVGLYDAVPGCACPPGQTFCPGREERPDGHPAGGCVDFGSDVYNCGGCGVVCPGGGVTAGWRHATPSCENGTCERTCSDGWGDCNGNAEDDCETNVDSDPKNCGGCGKICDAVAGQACVRGQCVVAPCEKDGGLAR